MILYFSGFFTCPDLVTEVEGDYGILISFLEATGKKTIPRTGKPLFLDSGAFSVMTGKARIDVHEYGRFLQEHKDSIEVYANLDVIGDHIKTQRNQEILEGMGLDPLPTFHFGSPYSVLEEMAGKYEYFGLGGLVPISKKKNTLIPHLNRCFSIIKKHWPRRVHGWGISGYSTCVRFPFYSIDSTSWLAGGKYKRSILFETNKLTNTKEPSNWVIHWKDLDFSNARNLYQMSQSVTRIWEKRGVRWDQ